jgi:hypothetical protein
MCIAYSTFWALQLNYAINKHEPCDSVARVPKVAGYKNLRCGSLKVYGCRSVISLLIILNIWNARLAPMLHFPLYFTHGRNVAFLYHLPTLKRLLTVYTYIFFFAFLCFRI